jgi:hypothetical protein
MLNKFGSDVRFPLTAAFSLSAVVAAMVAVAPSAQAQVPCVSVPKDPTQAPGTAPAGTPSATCAQYFAAGATFPAIFNRVIFDYYGISIPTGSALNRTQPATQGYQPSNPPGSPRNTSVQLNYCQTGSSNGRAIFTGVPAVTATSVSCSYANSATFASTPTADDPAGQTAFASAVAAFPTNTVGVRPLFAGSDTPLAANNITNYTNTNLATRGNPIQVPTVFGMIAPVYNPGVFPNGLYGGLNLTTLDLCRIYDGTFTDYSQLTGTTGLSGPIRVFVVSTISLGGTSISSSVTVAFTSYLASNCPTAVGGSYYLTAGVNAFPAVPQTFGFNSTFAETDIADAVATTPGGFGYVNSSFAQPWSTNAVYTTTTPAPFAAALQNPVSGSFIFPSGAATNRRLVGLTLTANATYPCVLTAVLSQPLPGNAFPIVSPTYTLAYTRYPTTAEANAVKGLYNFVLANRTFPILQANDQIAQGLGFAVLNNNSAAPYASTNALRTTARNCINTILRPDRQAKSGLEIPSHFLYLQISSLLALTLEELNETKNGKTRQT